MLNEWMNGLQHVKLKLICIKFLSNSNAVSLIHNHKPFCTINRSSFKLGHIACIAKKIKRNSAQSLN